jgi:hypothetical protein
MLYVGRNQARQVVTASNINDLAELVNALIKDKDAFLGPITVAPAYRVSNTYYRPYFFQEVIIQRDPETQ